MSTVKPTEGPEIGQYCPYFDTCFQKAYRSTFFGLKALQGRGNKDQGFWAFLAGFYCKQQGFNRARGLVWSFLQAGVIDRYKEHRIRPLAEHLRDFRQALFDRGDTKDHARRTYSRIEAIFKACGFAFMSEVQPSKVQGYIADRKRAGLGAKTCNYYLTAIKSFFNWMVNDRRIAENPLTHLKGRNAKRDIRRQRRALTLDEIDTLLAATLRGQKHHNLSGRERYLLSLLSR